MSSSRLANRKTLDKLIYKIENANKRRINKFKNHFFVYFLLHKQI